MAQRVSKKLDSAEAKVDQLKRRKSVEYINLRKCGKVLECTITFRKQGKHIVRNFLSKLKGILSKLGLALTQVSDIGHNSPLHVTIGVPATAV